MLKLGLSESPNDIASHDYPMGFVLLNAMRLAEVFSDDSNFQRFFTDHFVSIEYFPAFAIVFDLMCDGCLISTTEYDSQRIILSLS